MFPQIDKRMLLTLLVKSNATGALCSVLSVTWLCERDKLISQQLLPPPPTTLSNTLELLLLLLLELLL